MLNCAYQKMHSVTFNQSLWVSVLFAFCMKPD